MRSVRQVGGGDRNKHISERLDILLKLNKSIDTVKYCIDHILKTEDERYVIQIQR